MNKVTKERRAQVVAALVEGASINSVVRMTGISKPAILKLLKEISARHAKNIRMKNSAISHASAFNVTRYGASALPRIKMFRKNYEVVLDSVAYGRGDRALR
jgi:transposase